MVNRMNSDLSRTGAVERDIEQVYIYIGTTYLQLIA